MPTINDATVVASAYDTSGNGGRKLVRLSNGWLVSALKPANKIEFYVSKDNGLNFTKLTEFSAGNMVDIAIVAKGTWVYFTVTVGNTIYTVYGMGFDANTVGATLSLTGNFEPTQTAIGNVSLTINDTGTELHATWSSKNATYPNSFNIRYAKGTIAVDGSVTWGAVEQRTTVNTTGTDFLNPSIIVNKNGYPVIFFSSSQPGALAISNYVYNGSSWTSYMVYNGGTYAQSSPSAIFVPQSINGLANGRIWVAWHGTDSTDTTKTNIRYSYSDDGGVTWSTMAKVTSGNNYGQNNVSITANKNNEIFFVYAGADSITAMYNIRYKKLVGTTLSAEVNVSNVTATTGSGLNGSSTLYDSNFNFITPLFIYSNGQTAKVGFYGTWTVTTISVTQGAIGQKTDKTNLLSYSITTDGTMSTITEKVNGVTIGTKTATSGQSLIAGITQAQWDAIKYGKYADATGGANTLTVSMGSDIWTYTFDKRLATDADVLSAVKAVQDSQTTFLPSVKSKFGTAIRGKGGTVNDADSWDTMVSAVGGIPINYRKATGTITPAADGVINITGLTFNPSVVYAYRTANKANYFLNFTKDINSTATIVNNNGVYGVIGVGNSFNTNGFTITWTILGNQPTTWVAYE
jgi:hypothetical protein